MDNTASFQAFRPHVSLDVQDLTKSVEFYSTLFGQAPTKERPGYAKFSLTAPPLNFSMNERGHTGTKETLSHLGFEVLSTAEVLSAKDRLEAHGIAVREEMEQTCCYAKQNKIWASDPDGIQWEIFVVTDSDTARGGHDTACCVPDIPVVDSACCVPGTVTVNNLPCC